MRSNKYIPPAFNDPSTVSTFLGSKNGKSFTPYTSSYLQMLGAEVKTSFDLIVRDSGGCTGALDAQIFDSEDSLAALERGVANAWQYQRRRSLQSYLSFATTQQTLQIQQHGTEESKNDHDEPDATLLWPPYLQSEGITLFSPPSKDVLSNLYMKGFSERESALDGAMMNRSPGAHASSDNTFKVAGRVRGQPAGSLFFVLGENHHIITWAAVTTEGYNEVRGLLQYLATRLKRLESYSLLQHWWDDTCCNRAQSVYDHVVCQIFSAVLRAPLKDSFHAAQLITNSLDAASTNTPARHQFAREVGQVFSEPSKTDVARVVKYLMSNNRSLTQQQAQQKALQSYRYAIRTQGNSKAIMKANLQAVKSKWHTFDQNQQLLDRPRLYRDAKAGRIGTLEQFANVK